MCELELRLVVGRGVDPVGAVPCGHRRLGGRAVLGRLLAVIVPAEQHGGGLGHVDHRPGHRRQSAGDGEASMTMVIQHGGRDSSGDSGQHLDHFTAPEYTKGAP